MPPFSVLYRYNNSATRNARKFQSGHSGSEETRPLNPNRNDYEDIENPFPTTSAVSKLDKEYSPECVFKTSCVLTMLIVVMLIIILLQWIGVVPVPGFPNDNISDC